MNTISGAASHSQAVDSAGVTASRTAASLPSNNARQISRRELNEHKERIQSLYAKHTFKELKTILLHDGIVVSDTQLHKALSQWGFTKTISGTHKDYMIGVLRARRRQGQDTTFLYRGNPCSLAILDRHIKDYKLNEAYLAKLESQTAPTPMEITYSTPNPDNGSSSLRTTSTPSPIICRSGADVVKLQYPNTKEAIKSMTPASLWQYVPALGTPLIPCSSSLKEIAQGCYERYCGTDEFSPARIDSLTSTLWDEEQFYAVEELDRLTIELAEHCVGSDHLYTLQLQRNLACTIWSQGRYREAEQLESTVLERMTDVLGGDDEDVLELKGNLSCTYREQGKWEHAQKLGNEVLDKIILRHGNQHRQTLVVKHNLAKTYWLTHRWSEARTLLEQVVHAGESLYGSKDTLILQVSTSLVTTLQQLGLWNEASILHERINASIEGFRCPKTLLWTFEAMRNHGHHLIHFGDCLAAEKVFRLIIGQQRRTLSIRHPDVLMSKSSLAATLYHQAKYKEAEMVGVEVLMLREEVLGHDHPMTLTAMANLAWIRVSSQSLSEFESLMSTVENDRRRLLGEDHPDTLNSLRSKAWCFSRRGKWIEAEATYRKLEERQRAIYKVEAHPELIQSLVNIAAECGHRGNHVEAEMLLQKAHGLSRRLGEHNPNTLAIERRLVESLAFQGRFQEAEKMASGFLSRHMGTFGANHPLTLRLLTSQGTLRVKEGRWDEAEKICKRILRYAQEHERRDPIVACRMMDVAECCKSQDKYDEADQLYTTALDILREYHGDVHLEIARAIIRFASLRAKQKKWQRARDLYSQSYELHNHLLGSDHPDTVTTIANLAWIDREIEGCKTSQKQFNRFGIGGSDCRRSEAQESWRNVPYFFAIDESVILQCGYLRKSTQESAWGPQSDGVSREGRSMSRRVYNEKGELRRRPHPNTGGEEMSRRRQVVEVISISSLKIFNYAQ